jgi:hypothetical protein
MNFPHSVRRVRKLTGFFGSAKFGLRHGQSAPEDHERGFRSSGETEQAYSAASMHLLRWRLAEVAVQIYPALPQRFTKKQDAVVS